jgi:hypothetical protein
MSRSDKDVIREALYDAIGWQRGLVHAYVHIPDAPERAEALAAIKAYKSILRKRYGTDRHAGEDALAKMETINVYDLIRDG